MSKDVPNNDIPVDLSNYPKAGEAGYSTASCIYCPRAEYAPAAGAKKMQGVIELVAIVGKDGRVLKISVVKGLPGGLTLNAINAVKNGN